MTGKTLREQLPPGNSRNKIEYLADELQHGIDALAAMQKMIGGEPVVNLIRNGNLTALSITPTFNMTSTFTPKATAIDMDAYSEANSTAAMFPSGWGGEAVGFDNGFRSSFGVRVDHRGPNVMNRDWVTVGEPKGVKSAMVFHGLAYKAVALAPFVAQKKETADPQTGFRNEYVTVAASVRFGMVCKWGLVELHPSTGDIEKVVFCESFRGSQSNHSLLRKDGLTLDREKRYALAFYDIQPEFGNGADGLVIGWAAAFYNDEQNPELLPRVWPDANDSEFHIIKTATPAEILSGVALDVGHFTGETSHPNRHVCLRVCAQEAFDNNFKGLDVHTTETRVNGQLTISAPSANGDTRPYAICAKTTSYPQRIGFFDANGGSAFDNDVEYVAPSTGWL